MVSEKSPGSSAGSPPSATRLEDHQMEMPGGGVPVGCQASALVQTRRFSVAPSAPGGPSTLGHCGVRGEGASAGASELEAVAFVPARRPASAFAGEPASSELARFHYSGSKETLVREKLLQRAFREAQDVSVSRGVFFFFFFDGIQATCSTPLPPFVPQTFSSVSPQQGMKLHYKGIRPPPSKQGTASKLGADGGPRCAASSQYSRRTTSLRVCYTNLHTP